MTGTSRYPSASTAVLFAIAMLARTASAAAPSYVEERTFLDNIKSAGLAGYVIILLSLAGIALVVACAMRIRRGVILPPFLVSDLEQAMNAGDVARARELCARATALRNVLFVGLARLDDGPEAAARGAHLAAEKERLALRRFTGWLLFVAASSVILGALATVGSHIRIYTLFTMLKGSINPSDLWEGYSMALIPAWLGLSVAFPLFPAWWFFSGRAAMLAHEIEMTADDLIARVADASTRKDQPTTGTLETT